ncbi:MAG: endolytic transglycosylase MltG [bacterium]
MIKKILLFILTIILVLPIIVFYQIYVPVNKSSSVIKTVNIRKGIGLKEITKVLRAEGVIRDALVFEWLIRVIKFADKIKAGEYELTPAMNMPEIISKLVRGDCLKTCFAVPEGYNIFQIADLLAKKGFVNRERFIQITKDEKFIFNLGIYAQSLEGYLFPETYYILKGTTEEEIIRLMVSQLNKVITSEDKDQASQIGLSFHRVLTLASIIEKETKAVSERHLISAVFHNRLKTGMPLKSDPTVIYALGERFNGNLKKEDLKIDSPYNTYRYKGLPPGPIANPGLSAIKSALYPARVDYLYFVSMNNGMHKFSTTLKEHNEAVLKYQLQFNRK